MSSSILTIVVDCRDARAVAQFWSDALDNPDRWAVLTDLEGNQFCVTSTTTLSDWFD